jgi:hypothetical protein
MWDKKGERFESFACIIAVTCLSLQYFRLHTRNIYNQKASLRLKLKKQKNIFMKINVLFKNATNEMIMMTRIIIIINIGRVILVSQLGMRYKRVRYKRYKWRLWKNALRISLHLISRLVHAFIIKLYKWRDWSKECFWRRVTTMHTYIHEYIAKEICVTKASEINFTK